jgi:putative addiction module component (TIGR02574 family)
MATAINKPSKNDEGKKMLTVQIEEEALKLKPVEKVHLAELLLVSLDRPDSAIEQKWVEESERRYAAYKRGEIQGLPLNQFTPRLSK